MAVYLPPVGGDQGVPGRDGAGAPIEPCFVLEEKANLTKCFASDSAKSNAPRVDGGASRLQLARGYAVYT